MSIILLFLILTLIFFSIRLYLQKYKEVNNVCVVVLGDIGRSPRMLYHAISLNQEGFAVDVIGYPGSKLPREIVHNDRIMVYYLSPPPNLENRLPQLMCYVVKTLWQGLDLCLKLFLKPNVSTQLLLQNPPAIPTFPICWFYCITAGSNFIIDWHNYAYTIMALSLKKDHFLVKLAKFIEMLFGSAAESGFCVSQAMKDDLEKNWGIKADVLYDRPAKEFKPISSIEKHEFLTKLPMKHFIFRGEENSTIVTNAFGGNCPKKPGFIVSSTSWTEDEDFSLLLSALQDYENAIVEAECNLPDLICVITGKGPLREFYRSIIKLKSWKHVKVLTPWLEIEDYPKILASADLGICLHTSSSGLDLPMKVVDMFGCELPVLAYKFKCLEELVIHNENGMVFSTEKELAEQLKFWFMDFPNNERQRKQEESFRKKLHEFQQNRWHDNWSSVALNHFNRHFNSHFNSNFW